MSIVHKDRLGREIRVRDVVAYGDGNKTLGVGPVIKINTATVRVGGGGDNYPNQVMIINEHLQSTHEGQTLFDKLIGDYEERFDNTPPEKQKITQKWRYGVWVCCDVPEVTDESQVSVHIVKLKANSDYELSCSVSEFQKQNPQYFGGRSKYFGLMLPEAGSSYRKAQPVRIDATPYGRHPYGLLLRDMKEYGFDKFIGQKLSWGDFKTILDEEKIVSKFDPLVTKQK